MDQTRTPLIDELPVPLNEVPLAWDAVMFDRQGLYWVTYVKEMIRHRSLLFGSKWCPKNKIWWNFSAMGRFVHWVAPAPTETEVEFDWTNFPEYVPIPNSEVVIVGNGRFMPLGELSVQYTDEEELSGIVVEGFMYDEMLGYAWLWLAKNKVLKWQWIVPQKKKYGKILGNA